MREVGFILSFMAFMFGTIWTLGQLDLMFGYLFTNLIIIAVLLIILACVIEYCRRN